MVCRSVGRIQFQCTFKSSNCLSKFTHQRQKISYFVPNRCGRSLETNHFVIGTQRIDVPTFPGGLVTRSFERSQLIMAGTRFRPIGARGCRPSLRALSLRVQDRLQSMFEARLLAVRPAAASNMHSTTPKLVNQPSNSRANLRTHVST